MDDFIEVGGYYSYKGHEYEVTRYEPGAFLTKDSDSGNWSDAVQYEAASSEQELGHAKGMVFVRSKQDFTIKFERV